MILKDFLRYPGVIHTFQSIVKGKEIKIFKFYRYTHFFNRLIRATDLTFAITSSWTKLKLIANSEIPKSK